MIEMAWRKKGTLEPCFLYFRFIKRDGIRKGGKKNLVYGFKNHFNHFFLLTVTSDFHKLYESGFKLTRSFLK